jgi:hypothetical protein
MFCHWLLGRTPPEPPAPSYYYEPRYCTCTGDHTCDSFGMCLDCLRLVAPEVPA